MIINIILVAIIAVIVFFGIKSAVKHFQGKGSCCGGGTSTVLIEPKPLEKVFATKTVYIEGMKCENCSNRIQNALNSMENVNATVKLHKKLAEVKIGENVTDEQLKSTIEKLGYKVTKIL